MEAHQVTMEAHHDAVEAHHGSMEAHHGAVEAHHDAIEPQIPPSQKIRSIQAPLPWICPNDWNRPDGLK